MSFLSFLPSACHSHQPPTSLPAPVSTQPSKKRALATAASIPVQPAADAIAGTAPAEGATHGPDKKKRKRRGKKKKKKADAAGDGDEVEDGAAADAAGAEISMEL